MLVYLASPYSHPDPAVRFNRFQAVCRAAAKLMREGHQVFSPIAHSHSVALFGDIGAGAHDFWWRQDEPWLRRADALYILKLDGWEQSEGIARERGLAEGLNKPITFVEP